MVEEKNLGIVRALLKCAENVVSIQEIRFRLFCVVSSALKKFKNGPQRKNTIRTRKNVNNLTETLIFFLRIIVSYSKFSSTRSKER